MMPFGKRMTSMRRTLMLLWFWLYLAAGQEVRPELTISQGTLRGRIMRTRSGREFFGFLGIPYASPPVGTLRFMPPVRHPGWGVVLDATNFRSPCPQYDSKSLQVGEENCLFVNVFTPSLPRTRVGSELSFPVMVFFHGGFFDSGSSNIYGPERFLDKGVILVTLNYRLGVLGFLSTGDENVPGNYGLLDQNMALQWVRENIPAFGGNPNLVTIFGQDAGAASVTIHMVAPQSQGLFSRAIAQSGSALCQWSVERNPLEYALEVSSKVRCPRDNVNSMIQCLRKADVNDILRAQNDLKVFGSFPVRTAPVIERTGSSRFLPEEPLYLMERESIRRVPFIAGVNRDEGVFLFPEVASLYRETSVGSPDFLKDVLLPRYLHTAGRIKGNTDAVVRSLMFEYFSGVDPYNLTSIIKPFANMSGDNLFFACTDQALKAYSRFNVPTYMYLFSYRGTNTMVDYDISVPRPAVDLGVSHGDELNYMFQLNVQGLRPPSLFDNFVSSRILTLWTDFARFGESPQFINSEYPRWDPFNPDTLSYYEIDSSLHNGRGYRQRFVDLWLKHIPSLVNPDPSTDSLVDQRTVPIVYRTVSWALVAVCLGLVILIIVLLAILYNQKKSQSFRARDESGLSTSTLY